MNPKTIVAVVVTSIHQHPLMQRVKECGTTYRFETHLDTTDGTSVRVACLCPDGHGVAHLPWRGWFTRAQGRYDLTDIPEPERTSHLVPPASTEADRFDATTPFVPAPPVPPRPYAPERPAA